MRVNGWHRLWLLFGVIWLLAVGVLVLERVVNDPRPGFTVDPDLIASASLLFVVGWVGLLVVGHAVAWVLRGFDAERGR